MIEKAWDWDNVSSDYWDIPSEDMYYYLHKWQVNESKILLDLGCGSGRHALLFASHGFDVTAFDLSESGLLKLRKKASHLGVPINTVSGNMVQLPFEDVGFDFIIAYNSIYHTDSIGIRSVISEIERVLKPEGEIFLTFLSKHDRSFLVEDNKQIDEWTKLKKEEDGSELPHFYVDHADIVGLFKNFKILSIRQIENFYNNKSSLHYCVYAKKVRKD